MHFWIPNVQHATTGHGQHASKEQSVARRHIVRSSSCSGTMIKIHGGALRKTLQERWKYIQMVFAFANPHSANVYFTNGNDVDFH